MSTELSPALREKLEDAGTSIEVVTPYTAAMLEDLEGRGIFAHSDRLDQHFLVDETVIDRIVDAADLRPNDSVLEIGPGPGNLTAKLWEKLIEVRGRLATVEIDPQFQASLEQIPEHDDISMYWGDAIKELKSIVAREKINKIVANLPYSIIEPLLIAVHASRLVETVVLLVGISYAKRAMATIGPKGDSEESFTRTSLMSQARFQPEIVEEVGPEKFFPAPATKSAILKLNPAKKRNPDFFAVAEAISKRPRQTVNGLLSASLQRKFPKHLLRRIDSEEDARQMAERFPTSTKGTGLPEDMLKMRITDLGNSQLERLLLKMDLTRKQGKGKKGRRRHHDEDDWEDDY